MDHDRALDVLGLKAGASAEQIREAYRDLAKVWHPDRFPNDDRLQKKASDQLKAINEAYTFLRQEETNEPPVSEPAAPKPTAGTQSRPRRTERAHGPTPREVEYRGRLQELLDGAVEADRRNRSAGGIGWLGLFFGSIAVGGCVLPRLGFSGNDPPFLVAGVAGVVGLVGMVQAGSAATKLQTRLLHELTDVRCWSCDSGVATAVVRSTYGHRPGRQVDVFSRIAETARSVLRRGECPACAARWFGA
jgi:hypothetical protein